MSAATQPQLDLTEQPDGGARYRLPRPTGLAARLRGAAGLALVVLLPPLVPLYFVPRGDLPVVLLACGGVLLAAGGIGAWLLWAEVRKSAGPAEVLVGPDGLEARGGLGPFRWTRRRPLLQVHCLLLEGEGDKQARLQALCFRDPPLLLARSVPRDVLEPLARDLAGRITKLDPTRDEAVEVRDERSPEATPGRQPARSRIIVAEQGDGVVFTVPPVGFRGSVLVLLGAGGLYLAWSVAFVYQALSTGVATGAVASKVRELCNVVVQSGVGLWWVGWGLNRAARRVVFLVRDGVLRVEEHHLLGERSWQWSRDELRAVTAGPVGLVIQPHVGKAVCVNDLGRSDLQSREAELRWLAAALRKALGLAHGNDSGPPQP